MENGRNKLILFGIIAIVVIGGVFVYLRAEKSQREQAEEAAKVAEEAKLTEKYNYQDISYNFWGFVTKKGENTLFVEGVSPDVMYNENKREDESVQTVEFEVDEKAKIAKVVKNGKATGSNYLFIKLKDIQVGNHLALKSEGAISGKTKKAKATDILVLLPVKKNLRSLSSASSTGGNCPAK